MHSLATTERYILHQHHLTEVAKLNCNSNTQTLTACKVY